MEIPVKENPMNHEIKAVAFDLDGTLYPNWRLNIRLLPFLIKEWRFLRGFGKVRKNIRLRQEQSPGIFTDFYDFQAHLTAEQLGQKPQFIKGKIEKLIYQGWEKHFLKIKLFPHVLQVLTKFKSYGLKLGLLSDFPAANKLKNLRIESFWDTVLCSEDTGALKPAKEPFMELANSLGLKPCQILYVGDSGFKDIFGARRAGMKTALKINRLSMKNRKFSHIKADFFFNDYRKLSDFMLK